MCDLAANKHFQQIPSSNFFRLLCLDQTSKKQVNTVKTTVNNGNTVTGVKFGMLVCHTYATALEYSMLDSVIDFFGLWLTKIYQHRFVLTQMSLDT